MRKLVRETTEIDCSEILFGENQNRPSKIKCNYDVIQAKIRFSRVNNLIEIKFKEKYILYCQKEEHEQKVWSTSNFKTCLLANLKRYS